MRRSPRCTTTSATGCIARRSTAGGCPTSRTRSAAAARSRPAPMGFVSFPEPRTADDHKVRGKAEKFADHYTQATLFWNSQTDVEKTHIIKAFRFELSRVQTPADPRADGVGPAQRGARAGRRRWRMVSASANCPPPMPKALARASRRGRHVRARSRCSPGRATAASAPARSRSSIADGFEAGPVQALADRLAAEGAVPRLLGPRIGAVEARFWRFGRGRRVGRGDARRCSTTRSCWPTALPR